MSTEISWTDETWNPTTGCSKVSEGCRNCYAAKLAPRLAGMGQKGYTTLPWTKKNAPQNVMLHEDRLDKPLRWKKPRRIFVDSMSDLFHPLVPLEFIDKVFAVMALAEHHTFQVLTKRPERMAEYMQLTPERHDAIQKHQGDLLHQNPRWGHPAAKPWPLPNVWLGTSVEDQRAADERIPHLLRTPAAVRFLSCEPLLGPVDLNHVRFRDNGKPEWHWDYRCSWIDALNGAEFSGDQNGDVDVGIEQVHWVIAGGESGPGYREMDPAWPRSLRDQCVAAGVPFFFKQSSGLRNEMDPYLDGEMWREFPQVKEVVS